MKKSYLIIEKMWLMSQTEQTANSFEFHPTRTIITSDDNEVGKSSLVKSIYQTLGGKTQFHRFWTRANVLSILQVKIKGVRFFFLRDKNKYAIYDSNKAIIELFEDEPLKFSTYVANLLEYHIKLKNHEGEYVTPPISYLLSPYYLDQDRGWEKSWNSFLIGKTYMGTGTIWNEIIEYLVGKRDNDYYRKKGEIRTLATELKDKAKELKILKRIQLKTEAEIPKAQFSINKDLFEKEITILLNDADELRKLQNKLKVSLNEFYNYKININNQIRIVKKSLNEIEKDYNYVLEIDEEEIICPMCGVIHENSLTSRFEIARERQDCYSLLDELYNELTQVQKNISKHQKNYDEKSEKYEELQKLLQEKKEKIKLSDIIDSQGRKLINDTFIKELEEVEEFIVSSSISLKRLKVSLKATENKELIKRINKDYKQLMSEYLFFLKASGGINETLYNKMQLSSTSKGTGSSSRRVLLALFYSVIQLIHKHSKFTVCPIVIDTINQQGQSKENLGKILELIDNKHPKEVQLIIAVGDIAMEEYNFKGKKIILNTRNELLKKEKYSEIFEETNIFIKQLYSRKKLL